MSGTPGLLPSYGERPSFKFVLTSSFCYRFLFDRAVFTVCFVIINIVVFTNPWLGSTEATEKEGYFSLWESCVFDNSSNVIFTDLGMPVRNAYTDYRFECQGNWKLLWTSVNPTATFFIGISALLNLLCIGTFLVLFLFINPTIIFMACGLTQVYFKLINFIRQGIEILILKRLFRISF